MQPYNYKRHLKSGETCPSAGQTMRTEPLEDCTVQRSRTMRASETSSPREGVTLCLAPSRIPSANEPQPTKMVTVLENCHRCGAILKTDRVGVARSNRASAAPILGIVPPLSTLSRSSQKPHLHNGLRAGVSDRIAVQLGCQVPDGLHS